MKINNLKQQIKSLKQEEHLEDHKVDKQVDELKKQILKKQINHRYVFLAYTALGYDDVCGPDMQCGFFKNPYPFQPQTGSDSNWLWFKKSKPIKWNYGNDPLPPAKILFTKQQSIQFLTTFIRKTDVKELYNVFAHYIIPVSKLSKVHQKLIERSNNHE